MALCPSASRGLVEGSPPQLWLPLGPPGRSELLGIAMGTCRGAPGASQLSQPGGRRKPYLPQVPCSRHSTSCLNLVLAPRRPPHISLREGPPQARAGVGQRQAPAWHKWGPGWAGGSPPAVPPEVLTARLLCRHLCWHKRRCQCLFIFLDGDAVSLRWLVGVAPGPGSPRDGRRWSCKPGRGALLAAPPGSSTVAGIVPFPPKDFMTDVLSCF